MVDRGLEPTRMLILMMLMVSVLALSVVDHWFIGGVMVSVLAASEVDRGFIGGLMAIKYHESPTNSTR